MASIRNLKLSVDKQEGARSEVTVSYDIHFSALEVAAGATFAEEVVLRADDVLRDKDIGPPLLSQPLKAQDTPVSRSITRKISNDRLNEDADTIILGYMLSGEDEIYARVTLMPVVTEAEKADSAAVRTHF